jgi:hypothetical protein
MIDSRLGPGLEKKKKKKKGKEEEKMERKNTLHLLSSTPLVLSDSTLRDMC